MKRDSLSGTRPYREHLALAVELLLLSLAGEVEHIQVALRGRVWEAFAC
jgi:hypothetical protein